MNAQLLHYDITPEGAFVILSVLHPESGHSRHQDKAVLAVPARIYARFLSLTTADSIAMRNYASGMDGWKNSLCVALEDRVLEER